MEKSTESDYIIPPASTGKMMLFALPRIGSSLLLGVINFGIMLLYSDGYGIPSEKVAYVMSGGFVAIALAQFFFGWLSDVTYSTKFGGRKPYVFILAPLLAISFLFLLMPGLVLQNPNENTLFIWLVIFYILFEICYSSDCIRLFWLG